MAHEDRGQFCRSVWSNLGDNDQTMIRRVLHAMTRSLVRRLWWLRRVSLEGPLERVEGRKVLRIPLDHGGRAIAPFAMDVSTVVGQHLIVDMPDLLCRHLGIGVGSIVVVSNRNGRLTVTSSSHDDR